MTTCFPQLLHKYRVEGEKYVGLLYGRLPPTENETEMFGEIGSAEVVQTLVDEHTYQPTLSVTYSERYAMEKTIFD